MRTTIRRLLKLGAVLNIVIGFLYFALLLVLGFAPTSGFLLAIVVAAIPLAIASSAMTLCDELSVQKAEWGGALVRRCIVMLMTMGISLLFFSRLNLGGYTLPLSVSCILSGPFLFAALACALSRQKRP